MARDVFKPKIKEVKAGVMNVLYIAPATEMDRDGLSLSNQERSERDPEDHTAKSTRNDDDGEKKAVQ